MNSARTPFDRYEFGGRQLLGVPPSRDGTARHGYGPPVFGQCGYQCAYCGYDMASPYEAWLNLSVDHVVPQHLTKLGWNSNWLLDLINLVTCCRACNEFLNGYRVSGSTLPASLEEFLAVRDRVYFEKLAHAQRRHATERERYAAARPAGPSDVQEQLEAAPAQTVKSPERSDVARRTQRITQSDIAQGQIRMPRETKALFPPERAVVAVDMLGHQTTSRWDPRFGPDQERSGVLRIGRRLMTELTNPDETLEVRATPAGVAIRRPSR